MFTHQMLSYVTPPPSARLSGSQTVIIVVVLVLGVALTRMGLPVVLVAEVLATCGLIGVHLARRSASAAAEES